MEQMATYTATEQLTNSELELNTALTQQATLVSNLTNQYVGLVAAQTKAAGAAGAGARSPMMGPQIKMATGGKVPGAGSTDKVPALLTPGEFVVKKSQAGKHSGFLSALNNGSVQGFAGGGGVGNPYGGYQTVTSTQMQGLEKIVATLGKNIGSMTEATARATTSLSRSAKEGEAAGVAISRFKQELEGMGSYDIESRARAHVIEPLERSTQQVEQILTSFAQESRGQVSNVVEGIMMLDGAVREAAFDFEIMGSAVANMPESINALMSRQIDISKGVGSGGIMSAGGVSEQLQHGSSDELFRTFGAQANALGVELGEATQMAQGLTEGLRQKAQTISDNNADAIFVESQSDAAEVMEQYEQQWRDEKLNAQQIAVEREKIEANLFVLNDVVQQVITEYQTSLSGDQAQSFAKTWDTISDEAGAFRIKVKKGYKKYLTQLDAASLKISGIGDKTVISRVGASGETTGKYRDASTVSNVGTQRSRVNYASQGGREAKIKAAGQRDGQAYSAGVTSTVPQAEKAGATLPTAAAKGVQVTQKSNSPAKLFAKLGLDAVAGYVNGIVSGASKARSAGAKLANSAAQGAAGSPQVNAAAQQRNTAALNGSTSAIQRVTLAARAQAVVIQGFNTMTLAATSALGVVARNAKKMGGVLMRGSGKLSAVMGSATGAVFAMSMFEGPMQELSQKIMPFVFGLTAVQQLLPLFSNPWMIAIGAIVAVGGSLWYLNKLATDTIIAQREYTKALYGSAKEIEAFGEFTGQMSKSEKDRLRKLNDAGAGVSKEELTQAQSYLQGDSGKEFLESIKMVQDRDGQERAAKAVVDRLTRAVLQGSLSAELARAIASEVGVAMDNNNLGLVASVEINDIFGPDGKKLDVQDGIILYGKIIAEVELSDSIAAGGAAWDSSSVGSQLGMLFTGRGASDLASADAASKFGQIADLAAEQMSLFNQAIVEGDITVENFEENMDQLAKNQIDAYDYMLATKEAFERQWGKGSFDVTEQKEFTNALAADAQEVINSVSGFDSGETYFDDRNMKNLVRRQGGNQNVIDNAKIGQDTSAVEADLKMVNAQIEELINFQGAIAAGDFIPTVDGNVIDDIAEYNRQLKLTLSTRDEWLKGETQQGQLFDNLFNQAGETNRFGDLLPDAEIQGLRDAAEEATILGMKDGFSPEKLFATMPKEARPELLAAAKKMSTMLTDEWKELSKKDKKTFTVDFVTDTFGWDEETVKLFEGLSTVNRKTFILDYVTNLSVTGQATADVGLSNVDGFGGTGDPKSMVNEALARQNVPDTSSDPEGEESGGSKALSWVEQQQKAYAEASEIYGKTLKSKKGFMDQLVKGGKLDHEILKAAEGNFEAMQELANMTEKQQEVFNKQFMQTQRLNAQGSIDNTIAAQKRTTKAIKDMRQSTMTEEMAKFIQGNKDLMTLYSTGGTKSKTAATKGAKALMDSIEEAKSPLDKIRDFYKEIKSVYSNISKVIGSKNTIAAKGLEDSLGIDDEALKRTNQNLSKQINMIQVGQINPINEKIEAEEEVIDGIEREIELLERGTEQYEDQTKALNKQIEQLNRADEI